MSDATPAFRSCATCGGDLKDNEPVAGVRFTIRDNLGEHHSSCWGKPKRNELAAVRSAALEEAAKVADLYIEKAWPAGDIAADIRALK